MVYLLEHKGGKIILADLVKILLMLQKCAGMLRTPARFQVSTYLVCYFCLPLWSEIASLHCVPLAMTARDTRYCINSSVIFLLLKIHDSLLT
jgi:hypothetical protein